MVAYMLHDASMNGKPAADVDLGFFNAVSYEAFLGDLRSLLHSTDKDLKSRGFKLTYETQYPEVQYAFSPLMNDNGDNQMNVDIRIYREVPVWTNASMRLHVIYLDETIRSAKDATKDGDQMRRLMKYFFKFDYLSNAYFNHQVYSKLNHLREVNLSHHENRTNVAMGYVSKYSRRGITFNAPSTQTESGQALKFIHDPTVPFAERLRDAKDKYNALGLAVIPLKKRNVDGPGKAPACRDWMNKTSSFNFNTSKCDNIGIVCGEASGICCIDVDAKDNGMHYFAKLIQNYGLPTCPTQETPNGGRHYIFKYNPTRMNSMKATIKGARVNGDKIGIDLWIRGCQFVAEPSINHVVGSPYRWSTPLISVDDIPDLPEWIYDLYYFKDITVDGVIIKNNEKAPSGVESANFADGASEASSGVSSRTSDVPTTISHSVSNPPQLASDITTQARTSMVSAPEDSITIDDITSLNWLSLCIAPAIALLAILLMIIFIVMMVIIWLSFPQKMKDAFKHIFFVLFNRAINTFA